MRTFRHYTGPAPYCTTIGHIRHPVNGRSFTPSQPVANVGHIVADVQPGDRYRFRDSVQRSGRSEDQIALANHGHDPVHRLVVDQAPTSHECALAVQNANGRRLPTRTPDTR